MKVIENAYDAMEDKVSNWNTKRREILKFETKKALQVLSERDMVSFFSNLNKTKPYSWQDETRFNEATYNF